MYDEKREALLEHLTQYKRTVLGVQEDGLWKKRTPKTHILPEERQDLNLLELCRSILRQPSFPLHDGFHHLNSSQAMCINLLYPLIHTQHATPMLRHLGISTTKDLTGEFETKSAIEHVGERRTTFDFHLAGHDGPEVLFEVKYFEKEFGKAERNDTHLQKIEQMYQRMVRDSPYLATNAKSPDRPFVDFFLANYQLMRNLVHISHNSHLVLLFPRWNQEIKEQAEYARDELLTQQGRERLHIVFLEDAVALFETEFRDDQTLSSHYAEFRRKYLPELSVV